MQWCMDHPCMTFLIVIFAICVIGNLGNNILRTIIYLKSKDNDKNKNYDIEN